MKSILKLSFLIIFLSACKHKSAIDEKISEYISKNAHNPDSYESISTTLVDTVTEIENVNSEIEKKKYSIEKDSSEVEKNKRILQTDSLSVDLHKSILVRHSKERNNFYSTLDSMELASAVKDLNYWNQELLSSLEQLQMHREELGILETRLDSINNSSNPNFIYSFHFIHQFRAKVPLGGMMLKNAFVETDKDFNIIVFEEQ